MFSAVNNINSPTIPSLVATALPRSDALRVPYYTVPPIVASQQSASQQSYNQPMDIVYKTAQTNFLAQLAGGEISSEVRGIFVQYEKLVSYGNVKYRPSDAGKPATPAGLFDAILHEEQSYAAPITTDIITASSPSELPVQSSPEFVRSRPQNPVDNYPPPASESNKA